MQNFFKKPKNIILLLVIFDGLYPFIVSFLKSIFNIHRSSSMIIEVFITIFTPPIITAIFGIRSARKEHCGALAFMSLVPIIATLSIIVNVISNLCINGACGNKADIITYVTYAINIIAAIVVFICYISIKEKSHKNPINPKKY